MLFCCLFPIKFCILKDQASTWCESWEDATYGRGFSFAANLKVLGFQFNFQVYLCLCGLQTLLLWTGRCSAWLPRWPKIFITDIVGTGFSNHVRLDFTARHTCLLKQTSLQICGRPICFLSCLRRKQRRAQKLFSLNISSYRLHSHATAEEKQWRKYSSDFIFLFGSSIVWDPNKSLWEQKPELLLSRHKRNL